MKMNVVDAGGSLPRQARCIEVIDVVVLAVEEIEHLPAKLHPAAEPLIVHAALLAPKPKHRNGNGSYETRVRGLDVSTI
jgi:hypothetical protein